MKVEEFVPSHLKAPCNLPGFKYFLSFLEIGGLVHLTKEVKRNRKRVLQLKKDIQREFVATMHSVMQNCSENLIICEGYSYSLQGQG